MVERVHHHLKEGLKARGAQADWLQHLPWVLLNIRTAPKNNSNISAVEIDHNKCSFFLKKGLREKKFVIIDE